MGFFYSPPWYWALFDDGVSLLPGSGVGIRYRIDFLDAEVFLLFFLSHLSDIRVYYPCYFLRLLALDVLFFSGAVYGCFSVWFFDAVLGCLVFFYCFRYPIFRFGGISSVG